MSKKWLLGACGALLAGSLFASTASANLVISLSPSFINGAAVVPDPTNPNKVQVKAGDVVQVDIWMTITGKDTLSKNDGMNAIVGNLQTYYDTALAPAAGGVVGHMTANGEDQVQGDNSIITVVGVGVFANAPANGATGAARYLVEHLPLAGLPATAVDDGSMGLGAPPGDTSNGRVVLSNAGSALLKYSKDGVGSQNPYIKGDPLGTNGSGNTYVGNGAADAGVHDIVGSILFTVDSVKGAGDTMLNWVPWQTANGTYYQAAFWGEDTAGGNYNKDASTGNLSVGAPVILAVIPEPASLSLLGFGALGLLARRRK